MLIGKALWSNNKTSLEYQNMGSHKRIYLQIHIKMAFLVRFCLVKSLVPKQTKV